MASLSTATFGRSVCLREQTRCLVRGVGPDPLVLQRLPRRAAPPHPAVTSRSHYPQPLAARVEERGETKTGRSGEARCLCRGEAGCHVDGEEALDQALRVARHAPAARDSAA